MNDDQGTTPAGGATFDPFDDDAPRAVADVVFELRLEILKFGTSARGSAVIVDADGREVHADEGPWLREKPRTKFCRDAAVKLVPDVAPDGETPDAAAARLADVASRRNVTRDAIEQTFLAQLTALRAARDARREAVAEKRDRNRAKVDAGGWKPARLSQQMNAQQLVKELGGNARFNTSTGEWMVFKKSEGRFVADVRCIVNRFAKKVAAKTWAFVQDPPPDFDQKSAFKHAVDSERASGIAAAMKLAQSEPGIPVAAEDFDRDQFKLNVLNGVVDLRTGKLLPHSPDQLMTKLAPVVYDADARCPLWDSVLWRIMDESDEMIGYLQRLVGLCLTGDNTVQEMFIPHGGGANGKSVFWDLVADMLGDYAGIAPESLLTAKAFGSEHPTEIAGLCGLRMVVASETEDGAKLRIQQVKRLTGDKRLTGRFMRQNYFSFDRTHKTILVTNNRPRIPETTNAIWRRVRLIPFDVTIPPDERDPNLIAKLTAERSGVLNWAIAGCLDWQAKGMRTPDAVKVATEKYREEQDDFGEFVADNLVVGEGRMVTRKQLWKAYSDATQYVPDDDKLTPAELYERIRRIPGAEEKTGRVGIAKKVERHFVGIGLATLGDKYSSAQRQAGGEDDAEESREEQYQFHN